jgi:hypothetical protein
MKLSRFAQTLLICSTVATLILALAACGAPVSDDESATPTNDLPATVEAAVKATLAAQPTDTPAPDVEATDETDVQATVEVAVQSTVEVAVQSTLAAMPTSPPTLTVEEAQALQRLHRSYPAPTGYPGFRKYYQKRCYPGCHDDSTSGTPTPQVAHP